jgi:segregation and condensation protein A
VSLQEMLHAFKDVVARSNMFQHHHVQRERLSVRARMSEILDRLREHAWIEFAHLFNPAEGRMGVTVTFIALLELMREGLLEIVQAEVYGPIHVRPGTGARHLSVVQNDNDAGDVENVAALAQPALPDEDQEWDPDAESESEVTADDVTDEEVAADANSDAATVIVNESSQAVSDSVEPDLSPASSQDETP